MHRLEFDEETLKYFLKKIKEQLDKKHSREYFLVQVDENTEGALIVGTHNIDQKLVAESGFETGTPVVIKERIMLEIDFTNEEKQAISYFVERDGSVNEIDERLANFKFDVIDPGDFNSKAIVDELDPNTFYIISNNADEEGASHVAFIDDISTQSMLQNFIDGKVDKVDGLSLSDVDFTETYQRVLDNINAKQGDVITSEDIVDALDSDATNKPLSANQGKVLRTEYFGDHQFLYEELSDDNMIYGLTEDQVNMLQQAYYHSIIDPSEEYASLQEIYDARFNLDNTVEKNLNDRINKLESRLNNSVLNVGLMEDVIGYYGIHADFEDQTFKRIGKAIGLQSRDFDNIYPWAGMKRCNFKDGKVLCYEDEPGYRENGSNGDVMVEIPKFYYKVVPIRTEPANSGDGLQLVEAKWMIADKPSKGFKVHPAFIRNGEERDHIYVGAFEGCIFDVSANTYFYNDEYSQVNINNDRIASIAGAKPCSYHSIIEFRTLAQNKGDGYELIDFSMISAIQLLLLIEHASFDSQKEVGEGLVDGESSNTENVSFLTGVAEAVVYRGIENFWGNMWNYVDGINKVENYVYWSNDNYTSESITGYNKINFRLTNVSNVEGYADRFGYDADNDFVFLPTRLSGSTAIAPYDRTLYNTADTYVCLRIGGSTANGQQAGAWALALNGGCTWGARYVSPRIAYNGNIK